MIKEDGVKGKDEPDTVEPKASNLVRYEIKGNVNNIGNNNARQWQEYWLHYEPFLQYN